MKKLVISFLASLIILISPDGYGQEIDSSIIENLSSEQIAVAKEALNINSTEIIAEQNSTNKEQTLKNNKDISVSVHKKIIDL